MNKKVKILLLALSFGLTIFSVRAESVSLEEVLNYPDRFDSKTVEVEGETVGEMLSADKGAWVNIKDGSYNIGVFAQDKSAFEGIKYWGNYGRQGDWVKVKGTFNKDCSIHQISDLHLLSLEIGRQGYIKDIEVSSEKKEAAIKFFIICLTIAIIYFIKVKYGKRTTAGKRGV